MRRTDPQHRPVGQFIQDEICQPLGIDALWAGIPTDVEPRVAKLTNIPPLPPGAPGMPPDSLRPRATPPEVATVQEVFGRTDVRQACIPGAQGIMNARSQARFYAMLANGGELDGVRLLSEHRVRTFHVPRPPSDYDPVSGTPHNGTIGGFHFAGSPGMGAMGSNTTGLRSQRRWRFAGLGRPDTPAGRGHPAQPHGRSRPAGGESADSHRHGGADGAGHTGLACPELSSRSG